MVILLHIFDPQMVTIIDGKSLAQKLRRKIKEEVSKYLESGNRAPHLAAILVGEDGASKTYVASKERDCDFVGFDSTVHRLPVDTSENELLDLIDNKCFMLRERYYKILEKNKYNITEFQKTKIEEFMKKYHEEDKKMTLDLIERTELMLLNNS